MWFNFVLAVIGGLTALMVIGMVALIKIIDRFMDV